MVYSLDSQIQVCERLQLGHNASCTYCHWYQEISTHFEPCLRLCTGYTQAKLEQESISKYCSWFIKHYMALHRSTSQICSSLTPQQEHFSQQAVAIYSSLAPDPKKGRQLLVYMPHKNGTPCLTQLDMPHQ